MTSKNTPEVQSQIDNLVNLLEINQIFVSEVLVENKPVYLLTGILSGNPSHSILELSAMLARRCHEETGILCRIFPLEYLQHQVNLKNLFFYHACHPSFLVYEEHRDIIWTDLLSDQKILSSIQEGFDQEVLRVSAFTQGADFLNQSASLPQAAFMFHQAAELLYRYAELILMGKERKTHSIKEHKNYIKTFAPELENLFHNESEDDTALLKLLDEAYIRARYDTGYSITAEQLNSVKAKVVQLQDTVTHKFNEKFQTFQKLLEETTLPGDKTTVADISQGDFEGMKLKDLRELVREHFISLNTYLPEKSLYGAPLATSGYEETSYMASNILKVCILALDAAHSSRRFIPEPSSNIGAVLGYALQLIPHDEMEFLDKTREIFKY